MIMADNTSTLQYFVQLAYEAQAEGSHLQHKQTTELVARSVSEDSIVFQCPNKLFFLMLSC